MMHHKTTTTPPTAAAEFTTARIFSLVPVFAKIMAAWTAMGMPTKKLPVRKLSARPSREAFQDVSKTKNLPPSRCFLRLASLLSDLGLRDKDQEQSTNGKYKGGLYQSAEYRKIQ